MRFDLVVRGLVSFAIALCLGCKSPQAQPAVAAHSTSVPSKPLPLAIETFQAAWEIIRDTHFDTNFNGLDWNAVRTNSLSHVEKARSQEEVRETIQAMLNLLNVSHLMILPGTPQRRFLDPDTNRPAMSRAQPAPIQIAPRAEAGSAGMEVRVAKDQLVVFRVESGGAADRAGVKPGWMIEKIDDEPAIDVEEEKSSRGQREFLLWHRAASLLKGAAGEKCTLAVVTNEGEKKTVVITRGRESGLPAKLGNLPTMFTRVETNEFTTPTGKRIGHLWFNLWMMPAVGPMNDFIDVNRNSDGIIVDLRGNVGGIGGIVMGFGGHFVNKRVSLGQMTMRDNQLNFVAMPRPVDTQARPTNIFRGKLAVIVDAVSLSSSELFAGGMQELGRARVFGQPTGGQALPAVSDRLPNGDLLYHAVADFKTPKGRRLEENGVIPDEIVPLRVEALRAGRDDPLEAALRWIDSAPQ